MGDLNLLPARERWEKMLGIGSGNLCKIPPTATTA